MNYISTRGKAPVLDFGGALMAGLAQDGGLYLPDAWPSLSEAEIATCAGRPYAATAAAVMSRFTGETLSPAELSGLAERVYARFMHKAVAPIVQIDSNLFVLELFHGPTLAFKDFAMQMLALLMDRALRQSGERATIIGATSGDTGAAAIEAFKGRDALDIFVLFPHGRVSDVQRRQMTTAGNANVHTLAVEGSFDDCQAIVKTLFNDAAFRAHHRLSAVNSINWARIMAQIPYYFSAAATLGSPAQRVSFTVPTGNFGDIFAGYAAMKMGLPMERLVIATNANDILVRTLESGRYEPRAVVATTSPSMDIQISSNFERLLFEATGRDPQRLAAHMIDLQQHGSFVLSPEELDAIRRIFSAVRADEEDVARTISRIYQTSGYLADPHTAVGIHAAETELRRSPGAGPMIVLSTAHPAKFPEAVSRASGITPPIPPRLQAMIAAKERFTVIANNASAVKRFIDEKSRTAGSSAHRAALGAA